MNSKFKYDIKDDELRVIGRSTTPATGQTAPGGNASGSDTSGSNTSGGNASGRNAARKWLMRKMPLYVLFAVIALAAIIAGIAMNKSVGAKKLVETEIGLFDDIDVQESAVAVEVEKKFGMEVDPSGHGFTEKKDTVVNDIPLTIYIPHNAKAELYLRTPDINDESIVFCAQAADIRKDNKKIVGAFVLSGQPLAWGLSKKGYCSIINDTITIGVADNSPLFEEATEKGGYFFRQYPLVDNGKLVENEPKNKSIRKSLCERNGEIMVIVSNTPESFHDFAQALVDLGVDNAIYLVGSEYAKGWYRDADNHLTDFSKARRDRYKNETYILWRATTTTGL